MGRILRRYFYTLVLATLLTLPGLVLGTSGIARAEEPAPPAPALTAIDLPWGG